MKQILYVIVILSTFISCTSQEEPFKWLEGSWTNVTPTMEFHENWQKTDAHHWKAESFVLVKKDTVFYEHIDLVKSGSNWEYIVSVRNQNNEQPVAFTATKLENGNLEFENAQHDFPTRIVYKKITEDSLVATIFGTQKGKTVSEVFPMKKSHP